MAQMLPCYLHIAKGISTESPYTCKGIRFSPVRKISWQKRSVLSNKGCVVQCCSSVSSTSASSAAKQFLVEDRTTFQDREEQLENLVSEHGWRVRRLVNDEYEMREVAQIQAEAFHTPMALFDDLFFQFFKVFSSFIDILAL